MRKSAVSNEIEIEWILHYFFFFLLNYHRAEKRSAWRHERIKTLEKDAAIAQQMIRTMNEATDTFADKNEVIWLDLHAACNQLRTIHTN